jgi:hypothetical protein
MQQQIGDELDSQARNDTWTPKSGYLLGETVQYYVLDTNQWHKGGKVTAVDTSVGTYRITSATGEVFDKIPAQSVKAQPSAGLVVDPDSVEDTVKVNIAFPNLSIETAGGDELNVWVGFPGSYDKIEINMLTTSTVLNARETFAKEYGRSVASVAFTMKDGTKLADDTVTLVSLGIKEGDTIMFEDKGLFGGCCVIV